MIKGLTEYEKYKIIRPIIGECKYDAYEIPVMRKVSEETIDWESLKVIGYQNASPKTSDKNTLVLMFNYDNKLLSLWNNPLKKIGLFQGYAAVGSPDFSLSPSMNTNMIRQYVFMSRWLGVTWQNYNCTVLPTVMWALPDTYDICFSSIERGSSVIVSTIGCLENTKDFLNGFNEMRRRIEPPLIIVYGDMIDGMYGRFINFKYEDAFNKKKKVHQLRLDGFSNVFELKEAL